MAIVPIIDVARRFPAIYPYLGNAAQWIDNARKQGYTILSKPAADTVAVYGPSKISPLGHVAVVESVNSDGSINLSEMNNPYTPGGGYNLIDQRRASTAGIIGYIVPPGSTYSAPTAQKSEQCVTGSISVPFGGGTICFDGLLGVVVMIAGGLLSLGGLAVFAAFALKDTPVGRAAGNIGLISSGPAGAAVAASARSNAPRPSKPSVETDRAAAAASAQRVAVAKSRVSLSPETQAEVDAARRGEGKRLTPSARKEMEAA